MRALVALLSSLLPLAASSAEREVLVLREAMPRGAALVCEHTEVAQRRAEAVPAGALPVPCALADETVLRRPLGAGDLLRTADVGRAPAVAARAEVRLRVRVGAVQIEKPGTALGDAQPGETVLVRLAGSARALRGTVVGPNLVELVEER
jgi:flagella basal body P-ring formation protein FlgA